MSVLLRVLRLVQSWHICALLGVIWWRGTAVTAVAGALSPALGTALCVMGGWSWWDAPGSCGKHTPGSGDWGARFRWLLFPHEAKNEPEASVGAAGRTEGLGRLVAALVR